MYRNLYVAQGPKVKVKPRFVYGDAELLRMPNGVVDGVIMADVLEHLGDLRRVLSEVHRVLQPGGIFVFDTINRTRWDVVPDGIALSTHSIWFFLSLKIYFRLLLVHAKDIPTAILGCRWHYAAKHARLGDCSSSPTS
jgi:ubiquinone/menaquinone biosynthesis C-methylase UbiE